MARKKAEEAEYARPVTSGAKLKKLLAAKRQAKADMDEANGVYRQQLGEAKEKYHLNTSVFGTLTKLDKMEPVTLKLWLEDFHAYLDSSGIQKRADDVSMMDLRAHVEGDGEAEGEEEGGEAESDEESGRRAKNVKPFPDPRAEAAE